MKPVFRCLAVFVITNLLFSCRGGSASTAVKQQYPEGRIIENLYAGNFTITDYSNYRNVVVRNGGSEEYSYYLYRGVKPDIIFKDKKPPKRQHHIFIKIPVERVVSLSSENIVFLDALGGLDKLKGIDLQKNTSVREVKELVRAGKIIQTGEGRDIDTEILYAVAPDAVFSPWTGGDYDGAALLGEQGFPVIVTAGWLESHPLGRAEWMVFVSLFLDREEKGRELFRITSDRYKALKEAAEEISKEPEKKPVVLSNMIYGDSWGLPGGKSYAGILFSDAGAIYPWSDNDNTGSIFLDFETVFSLAGDARIWLVNSSGITTKEDILKKDSRYALFSAFKDGRIYNNNLMETEGGNPYWDEGTAFPDRILSDLIKIFHPQVSGTEDLNYFKEVK